jgi:hypothetical protein
MSGGTACKNAEHQPRWFVTMRLANVSAFSGGRRTSSPYSQVKCGECGLTWRSKAAYVSNLPGDWDTTLTGRHGWFAVARRHWLVPRETPWRVIGTWRLIAVESRRPTTARLRTWASAREVRVFTDAEWINLPYGTIETDYSVDPEFPKYVITRMMVERPAF